MFINICHPYFGSICYVTATDPDSVVHWLLVNCVSFLNQWSTSILSCYKLHRVFFPCSKNDKQKHLILPWNAGPGLIVRLDKACSTHPTLAAFDSVQSLCNYCKKLEVYFSRIWQMHYVLLRIILKLSTFTEQNLSSACCLVPCSGFVYLAQLRRQPGLNKYHALKYYPSNTLVKPLFFLIYPFILQSFSNNIG